MNAERTDTSYRAWLDIEPTSDFSIYNLPYGVFNRNGKKRVGVAIGDYVLDLAELHEAGMFAGTAVAGENVFARHCLNDFMSLGRAAWGQIRQRLLELLDADNSELSQRQPLRDRALIRMREVTLEMPVEVADYIDFYTSREHASNVGRLFRADAALPPNFVYMPLGYHGRSGTIFVSPHKVRRPKGQYRPDPTKPPIFGPTQRLDFELEVAFVVGQASEEGVPIPVDHARDYIFGAVLLNDLSARDIQQWEYQPLGPFLGKSFATVISPWVVPLAALEPLRVPGVKQEPEPLPYLRLAEDWAFDLHLEAWLKTVEMDAPTRLTKTNFRYLYWSVAQMLAHATINGARMRVGDLFASGTVSGPTPDSLGCMLELSQAGRSPVLLPSGETRAFLEDGDQITLVGYGDVEGRRVGFGECVCTVVTAD